MMEYFKFWIVKEITHAMIPIMVVIGIAVIFLIMYLIASVMNSIYMRKAEKIRKHCMHHSGSCSACMQYKECKKVYPGEVPGEMTKKEMLEFLERKTK